MTGQGGWPMTVFLDPDGRALLRRHLLPARRGPRHAELPDGDGGGRRRLRAQARRDPRARRRRSSARLGAIGAVEPGADAARRRRAARGGGRAAAARAADRERGGFGGAPKFPPASALELLLARGETRPVERTLDAMLAGGIYDQLGGGFARYSVDADLARPPLREDALRQRAAGRAPTCTAGRPSATSATGASARRRSTGCCARCAAPRAASTRRSTPTPRARRAASTSGPPDRDPRRCSANGADGGDRATTGSPRRGNFEGANILHLAGGAERRAAAGSRRGARGRSTRPAPSGSGRASTTSGSPPGTRWRSPPWPRPAPCSAATTTSTPPAPAPSSCSAELRDAEGRLLRTYKDGEARLNAYLEDHAFLLEALLTLYEASFESRWFERGRGRSPRR